MYAELADIQERVDDTTLIDLTDDSDAGVIDESVVDRAIVDAEAVINAAARDTYKVPFSPTPDLVRMYTVDLAIYNLYSLRPHIETPEDVKDRQKQALGYLQQVRQGQASLGIDPDASAGDESHGALVSGNDRIFTRSTMRNL